LLDAAQVELDWCYLSNWGPPPVIAGVLPRFIGVSATQAVSRTGVKITVKSWLSLLDVQVPSQLYGPSCRFLLGDSACGINLASLASPVSITSAATTLTLPCAAFNAVSGGNRGWVKMTSGVCRGLSRNVRWIDGGVVQLSNPLPWMPEIGDTLSYYPACDKTQATCAGVFGNGANFGGMPFVPVPETAF